MEEIKLIKDFYNQYAEKEWARLDRTPYDRINFHLHMDFISDSLKENAKVLDAGCGAGRFSIEFARRKCKVSLYDISETQLQIARDKISEAGLTDQIEMIQVGDISQMDAIADNTYDVTVCYGSPLNYMYSNYREGIKELYRVSKSGGKVYVSVNTRFGVIHSLIGRSNFDITDFLGRPDYWMIDQVVNTGNLSTHADVKHPPRHLFDSQELRNLFEEAGFTDICMASSPCLTSGLYDKADVISSNEKAWQTIIDLELKVYKKETAVELGEFLLLSASK